MAKHTTEIIADEDRCRRTDGKRWRCAFRRFGESRYCEKHHQYYLNKDKKAMVRVYNASSLKASGPPMKNQARVRVKTEPLSIDEQRATSGKKRGRPAKAKADHEAPFVKRERTEDVGEGVSGVRVSEAAAKKKGRPSKKNPACEERAESVRGHCDFRVRVSEIPRRKGTGAASGKKRGRPAMKQAAEAVPLVKREQTEDGGEGISGATTMKKRGRPAKNKAAQGKRTESGRGHGAYRARVFKTTDKNKRGRVPKGRAAQRAPVVKNETTEIGGGEGVSGIESRRIPLVKTVEEGHGDFRVRVSEIPRRKGTGATSGMKRGRPAKKQAAEAVPLVKREQTEDGGEGISGATTMKKRGRPAKNKAAQGKRAESGRGHGAYRVRVSKTTDKNKRGRVPKGRAAQRAPVVKNETTEIGGGEGVSVIESGRIPLVNTVEEEHGDFRVRVSEIPRRKETEATSGKKRGRPAKKVAAEAVPLVKREQTEDGGNEASGATAMKKRGRPAKNKAAQDKRTESGRGHGADRARVSKTTDKKKRGWVPKGRAAQRAPVVKNETTEIGGGEGVSGTKKNGEQNGIGDGEGEVRVMELSQIWAFPHESDGFPRFYARIERFIPTESLVQVTPLIPYPITKNELMFSKQNFSLACGMFWVSDLMTFKDISSATHRAMANSVGDEGFFYKIFPKKREVWATYTWDNLANSVEFKLVEVLSDFSETDGVSVAALAQVERSENCGFYQRQVHEGFHMVQTFSSDYMPMFSHQVLASRIVKYGQFVWKVLLP